MASFYCIYENLTTDIAERVEHLRLACARHKVNFVTLDSINVDYCDLPQLRHTDFLYNVARGSKNLESLLLNEAVNTFYISPPNYVTPNTIRAAMIHSKAMLSVPKTIFHATNDRKKLEKYVEVLNGFPVIVKASGGTLGVGTMIANDFQSLFSLTDFLTSLKVRFMLRQFIRPKEVARLIVIGDRVVAANEKFIEGNDFRTSVKFKLPAPKIYSEKVNALAIIGSRLANFENAGVDIIIDENDTPYLLEVNMPHDFVTTAKVTHIDVAEIMVEHLLKKLEK